MMPAFHLILLMLAHSHLSDDGVAASERVVIRRYGVIAVGADGVGVSYGEGLDGCLGRTIQRVEGDVFELVEEVADSHDECLVCMLSVDVME